MKKKKYWAGFCDGKIAKTTEDVTGCGLLAIYSSRKEAKKVCYDVRAVEIKTFEKE